MLVADWVLANSPTYVRSMRRADADLRARRVSSLDRVLAELDSGEEAPGPQRRSKAATGKVTPRTPWSSGRVKR